MTDHAAISATYSDFRLIRGRKVVQLVFEVPLEEANRAMMALGGMPNPAAEVWCAIARLDLEAVKREAAHATCAKPASDPERPARAPVAPEKRLAQRAGLLCGEPAFQKFLGEYFFEDVKTEDRAADLLRKFCCVSSRSHIVPNTDAGTLFELLLNKFAGWKADLE